MKTSRFATRLGFMVAAASSALLFLGIGQGAGIGEGRQTKPPVHAEPGQPFTLRIGQSAEVDSVRVTFVRVSQDSRCPSDVVCVWAGDAKVELLLQRPESERTQASLHSTLQPREVAYGDYWVTFRALEPYPESIRPIHPKEYRLTLTISKEPSSPEHPDSWSNE